MKRISRVLAVFAAVLVAAVIYLRFFINANDFRPVIESRLSQALGRQVKVGNLKLAIWSGGVSADDLSIADDPAFSPAPFIHAKSLKVGVEILPFVFSRKINVRRLSIDTPEIVLLQNSSGKWNFSSLGAKPAAAAPTPAAEPQPAKGSLDLTVRSIEISDGQASFQRLTRGSKPRSLQNIQAKVTDFSPASAFPFSITATIAGGGNVDMRGKLGPIDASDTAKTPGEATLKVKGLDLAAAGVADSASAIGGIASIEGSAKSDGNNVHVEGKLEAERLKLVRGGSPAKRPIELDFSLNHDVGKLSGSISRGDIHIGKASATVTGTYSIEEEPAVLHLKLDGPSMPLPELIAMLPAFNIVLPAGSSLQGGVAHAHFSTDGALGRVVTAGSLGIENLRLAGFDLGGRMSTMERLVGIRSTPNTDFQTISAKVKVAPDGTTVDDIRVVATGIGELTGAGTISPSQQLDFKMQAHVQTSGALMAALGQNGGAGIPFAIQGTSSNPVFKPDVKGIAVEGLKTLTGKDTSKAVTGLVRGLFGKKK